MGQYGADTALGAELVLEILVALDPPHVVGQTHQGYTKIIPIIGGNFCGQRLRGQVLPGGADWNTVMGRDAADPRGIRRVFAKYTIRTEQGVCISVENEGFKSMDPAAATEIVTVPRLQTAEPTYDWLNYGVFVGSLTPGTDGSSVLLRFYRMK